MIERLQGKRLQWHLVPEKPGARLPGGWPGVATRCFGGITNLAATACFFCVPV